MCLQCYLAFECGSTIKVNSDCCKKIPSGYMTSDVKKVKSQTFRLGQYFYRYCHDYIKQLCSSIRITKVLIS